jgi:ParB/RepB/Spo0J family partition protein
MDLVKNGVQHAAPPPSASAPAELQLVDLDPARVHTPPGNRKVTPDSVADLLPSVEKDGQLVFGIVYPHPDLPGEFYCADGNRRLMCCRILGRPFKAVELPSAPSKEELLRIRVTANFHRKNASAYELAADVTAWMELTGGTQKAAAEFFCISEGQLSKILAKARNACEAVRKAEEDKTICQDVARIIATLPQDRQPAALVQVIEHDMKRDAVEKLVANIKGTKPAKHDKPIKVRTPKGVQAVIPALDYDSLLAELGVLMEAVKKVQKHALPLASLPALLRA